eukprot:2980657-Pleurochrysis_carterae.AAC.3
MRWTTSSGLPVDTGRGIAALRSAHDTSCFLKQVCCACMDGRIRRANGWRASGKFHVLGPSKSLTHSMGWSVELRGPARDMKWMEKWLPESVKPMGTTNLALVNVLSSPPLTPRTYGEKARSTALEKRACIANAKVRCTGAGQVVCGANMRRAETEIRDADRMHLNGKCGVLTPLAYCPCSCTCQAPSSRFQGGSVEITMSLCWPARARLLAVCMMSLQTAAAAKVRLQY